MTKAKLVKKVSETSTLTKMQTEIVVNLVFDSMVDALNKGDKVELRGFGSFQVREYDAREGRNPKTGDSIKVPPKKRPFFKAGKALRKLVNT